MSPEFEGEEGRVRPCRRPFSRASRQGYCFRALGVLIWWTGEEDDRRGEVSVIDWMAVSLAISSVCSRRILVNFGLAYVISLTCVSDASPPRPRT